jgi:hexulose-6-phosphate isomerase
MQGRLSKAIGNKIQAFPWGSWEEEFKKAADIGFDEIEFIFEAQDYKSNPLCTREGLRKIKKASDETGIQVNYVCADYFMERPFFRVAESDRNQSTETLKHLIQQCAKIGIKGIEIPLVDNSKIETAEEVELLTKCLKECLVVAETYDVKLVLEASLNPDDFKTLLQGINHPLIGANYDTGNSASLGFNPQEEILKLGKWIDNVHIKDRLLGGGTVPLGEGDTDFELVFKTLGKIAYQGSFILQVARAGDEIESARKNIAFVRNFLNK